MTVIYRFSDWRGLRRALGLTQREMAGILAVTLGTYSSWERGKAKRAARQQTINQLRVALMDPQVQELLGKAGYPHPFPGDLKQTESAKAPEPVKTPAPEPAKAPARESRWPRLHL